MNDEETIRAKRSKSCNAFMANLWATEMQRGLKDAEQQKAKWNKLSRLQKIKIRIHNKLWNIKYRIKLIWNAIQGIENDY